MLGPLKLMPRLRLEAQEADHRPTLTDIPGALGIARETQSLVKRRECFDVLRGHAQCRMAEVVPLVAFAPTRDLLGQRHELGTRLRRLLPVSNHDEAVRNAVVSQDEAIASRIVGDVERVRFRRGTKRAGVADFALYERMTDWKISRGIDRISNRLALDGEMVTGELHIQEPRDVLAVLPAPVDQVASLVAFQP
jgi:hypothetical protein